MGEEKRRQQRFSEVVIPGGCASAGTVPGAVVRLPPALSPAPADARSPPQEELANEITQVPPFIRCYQKNKIIIIINIILFFKSIHNFLIFISYLL